MIIPVRCFSCNKPIGQYWDKFQEDVKKGKSPKKSLDEAGLDKYCCRQIFMGHVDLIDLVSQFKKF